MGFSYACEVRWVSGHSVRPRATRNNYCYCKPSYQPPLGSMKNGGNYTACVGWDTHSARARTRHARMRVEDMTYLYYLSPRGRRDSKGRPSYVLYVSDPRNRNR